MEWRRKIPSWRWLLWAACAIAATVVGCQTVQTTRGGEVGVDRPQRMFALLSPAEVEAAARQQYLQIVQGAARKGILNPDAKQTERVRAIAQRLIPHTAVFRDDAPRWQWEVNVLKVDQVNAWCMPGGKIAVYTGLIEKLAVSDDELAAVLGHEIAHALREHARERMSRQMGTAVGLSVVEILMGVSLGDVGQLLAQSMFVLPNSRENELEADRIGVELAARAGYDPRAAISLWKKMMTNARAQPPQWLSTHPSHETRMRDLEAVSQRVLPLYLKARSS
ncbi:MAG: M48 family metallopeptidase [Sutterellaceae bacterium]|nr:M48 family metallopeptidase [Burkholderiaceae bacterium]MCX7902779.1 M48 family metallopeptidase [Burkholderiaceae bacterium]MDW8430707.1 M48 family metallopeptidase [Sutterellaceae bacterium]